MPRQNISSVLPLYDNKKERNGGTPVGHAPQKTSTSGSITHKWRNELVAMAAEFAGTFMFLFFAFGGTQVANTSATASDPTTAGQTDGSITQAPNTSVLLFIALSFGFSLMVNVWVFFRVSGGLFNPAVTLGLFLVGALTPTRAILCFFSQMVAGMAAAAVISAILPGALSVSTTLGQSTSITQGVFLEMFLTALLVFTIFMLAAEKHKATFLAPVGIGLALFVAELVGVFYTGGSLNPARSFGPCVVTKTFPGYHYIYWVGPLMGTLLAFGMYKIVKSVEYETVNPGQDFDDHEAALFKAPSNASRAEQVERPNVAAISAQQAIRQVSHQGEDYDEESNGQGYTGHGHSTNGHSTNGHNTNGHNTNEHSRQHSAQYSAQYSAHDNNRQHSRQHSRHEQERTNRSRSPNPTANRLSDLGRQNRGGAYGVRD